jgi:uncharacterized protein
LLTHGDRRSLVIADVHLGLGDSAEHGFSRARDAAASMAHAVVDLAHKQRARQILIAGDLKHPILGLSPPLKQLVFDFASTILRSELALTLVLGNHDPGIEPGLPREVETIPSGGLLLGDLGVFHGHCWPAPKLARARTLLAGHLHPGYRFVPGERGGTGKERCWIRTTFPPNAIRFRRTKRPARARELVVLPAFNPIAGIESLNRDAPSRARSFLVRRFLAHGTSRAFLLDGTDLGELSTLGRSGPGAGTAARLGR